MGDGWMDGWVFLLLVNWFSMSWVSLFFFFFFFGLTPSPDFPTSGRQKKIKQASKQLYFFFLFFFFFVFPSKYTSLLFSRNEEIQCVFSMFFFCYVPYYLPTYLLFPCFLVSMEFILLIETNPLPSS
ncbi:hypothetical protein F4775DRAFT_363973 [Biscogniauxia sp. FL1348]|nr:hypothetical protein F4775DRAFT_363973 [Biscogniauxia sp. FL1348]